MSGQLHGHQMVTLHDIHLPEFDKNFCIAQQCSHIFDNDTCQYCMILSTNFITKTGIKLDYDTGQMIWYDFVIPMHPSHGLTAQDFNDIEDIYLIQFENEPFGHDWLETYATEILDAKYQWTHVQDVVAKQHHLTDQSAMDSHSDTQDEADRCNYLIQATIGAKEGAAEAISVKVSTNVTGIVLCNANGNDYAQPHRAPTLFGAMFSCG
jgi:hypothetical protein